MQLDAMAQARTEDDLIRRVFAVTLKQSCAIANSSPPVVHLASLAHELETDSPDTQLLLSKSNLERALMARLMEPPDGYPQWPVPFLLGAYARAADQFRMLPATAGRQELEDLLTYCKELAVSYVGLLLTMDMFPQPPEAQRRGALQLLDALEARHQPSSAAVPMPPDFLEQFAMRFEEEGLSDIIVVIGEELRRRLSALTAIGDFAQPLGVLSLISGVRPLARCMVALEEFLPASLGNGRSFSTLTLLGPAFSLAILTDRIVPGRPDVRQQYLANVDRRSPTEINSVVTSLRLTLNQLATSLHALVLNLLKKDTRERMLQWLFAAVESNAERAKTMPDMKVASPDGFFMNLAAVCIKLCQPFIEPSAKTWARIDPRYATWNKHIDFSEETKLSATQEEERAWVVERRASHGDTSVSSAPDYPFICEAFFLTAKVLHLGPVHVLAHRNHLAKQVQRLQEDAAQLERLLPSMDGPTAAMHQRQHAIILQHLDRYKGELVLFDAHLQDPTAMGDILAYCRLMAAWMLHLASPSSVVGGDISLPLPTPAPMEFRTLPEYFLEDLVDLLEWVAQAIPTAMDTIANNDFVNLVIVFLGSPAYIKNAHLRAKLVDLLHVWVAPQLDDIRAATQRRLPSISAISQLIQWHPLVQQNMVQGLLQLFNDIEHTDRHNTFFEKFTTRYKAGEILCHLWTIPQHRQAWKALATEQGGRGIYLSFCDVICNDSQYLLDDVIKTLPEVRKTEDLMADQRAWQSLSVAERAEMEKIYRQNTHNLKADLYLASVYIRVLRTTTEEITGTWLLPEMVGRVAAMLSYFLDHLAGKEKRKNLRVRDPEKYRWKPQELLAQLAHIYLHLSSADASGAFVAAIAADKRSYHDGLFSEAADVLRKYGLLAEDEVDALEALGEAVALAQLNAAEEEDILGDVPDEFLDPLLDTIMQDPVILPSSKVSVERATIERHLLSSKTDPFNKQPLSADQLVPNTELKAKIEAWKSEQKQRARRMQY